MSLFIDNIPQAADNLDFSQGELLSNNQGLNTLFGTDHYPLVDATANKGFHNRVTTPIISGSVHPTTTTNPIFYAMQDTAAIGLLQYSRGVNNAQPTPLTSLQSQSTAITLTPGQTTNLVDMTGVVAAIFEIHLMYDLSPGSQRNGGTIPCVWSSGNVRSQITFSASSPLIVQATGNIVQLRANFTPTITQLYWAVSFKRIVV